MISKYSASGNDFVIFHAFEKKDRAELTRQLCDRKDGIGADGLIVILPHPEYDFEWQFYNADGSSAEMCGNGSRAAAHYAETLGLAPMRMQFLTIAGVIGASVDGDVVESDLTPPKILDKTIEFEGESWWKLDTGVPHLVTFVEDIATFDLKKARDLRNTYNANVNIGYIDSKNVLHVRTYERGVEDETLACGTGMAAVFLRAYSEGLCDEKVSVYPKSNEQLTLSIQDNNIKFKGSVKKVFETSAHTF